MRLRPRFASLMIRDHATWIGAFFLLLGLLFVGSGSVWLGEERRFLESGVVVEGEVIAKGSFLRSRGSTPVERVHELVYRFRPVGAAAAVMVEGRDQVSETRWRRTTPGRACRDPLSNRPPGSQSP